MGHSSSGLPTTAPICWDHSSDLAHQLVQSGTRWRKLRQTVTYGCQWHMLVGLGWLFRDGSCAKLGNPFLPPVFTLLHGRSLLLALALITSQEMSLMALWAWGVSQLLRKGFPELNPLLFTTLLMARFQLLPLGITGTSLIWRVTLSTWRAVSLALSSVFGPTGRPPQLGQSTPSTGTASSSGTASLTGAVCGHTLQHQQHSGCRSHQ